LSSKGEFVPFVDGRARELASDPTLNVALEASAGTGKTRVLVERYVRLIEEGSAPRHILAITFTRKAAGEMKTRILEELRKRPELWNEFKTRLFEMHVTTIDAFCLGLLREFPLEAGLDPDVSLLDEVESARLQEEAIDHALSAARNRRGPDVRFLIVRFGEGALRRGIRDFLAARLVKEEVLARYVEHVVPPGVSLERSLERFRQALSAAFRGPEGVSRFLETGPDVEPSGFRALAFALRRAIDPETISATDVEEIRGYFLTGENEPRRRLSSAASPERFSSRETYERHRDRALGLATHVALAYRHWLREKDFYAVRQIESLYREASRRFAELKRARSGLDFVDVLVEAVELLEKRGEFSRSRFRLESRYHHLLIDEFQDTNDFQWRLIRALVDSWGEGSGLVQDAILDEQSRGPGAGRIREPSLFLVGDRKQSIYGWRDARVEVMESASKHLLRIRKEGGRRLTLRHSFRASGELLSFLNDLFAEIPKVRGDLEWSFQYREADHFPLGSPDARSTPVALAAGRDASSTAALVADEVVRILEEERLRPRDLAILFRSRSSYRVYEEALLSRGVPAYVYRGLGFFDSPEVMDVQALVRFLAEPQSELRAAELARSRLVAMSDPGLMRIAAAKRATADRTLSRWLATGALDLGLPLSSQDRTKADRSGRLMTRLLSLVDRIPPGDLLELALRESDYARWFAFDRQSRENLKKVMEMVRRAQNRGYLTMSRLADFLASASTDEESPAVLEAVDAVNLMTIHASKGLEFDSVFLVNLHQRRREDNSLPRIRELADGRVDISALAPTALSAEPSDEVSRVLEEEKRLLYVALTRARRSLTLSAIVGGENRGTLLELLPRGLQESIQIALRCAEPTVEWRGHSMRVLRPRQMAKGAAFLAEKRERKERLRLEPLGPDALEVLDEEHAEDAIPRGDRNLESLSSLLRSGEVYRDVPFSLAQGARVLRGSFERLVVTGKRVTLIAFPDPPHRDEHRLRMERSLEAAAAIFAGREVSGLLVYPEGAPIPVRRGESEGDSDGQLSLF
jgi:ATP-dependent helicase/nuclease subunit A